MVCWSRRPTKARGKTANYIDGKWQFEEYQLGPTKWDGYDAKRNVLLDAKGNYTTMLKKGWAQEGLRKEALNQIQNANGVPIEWHFQNKEDADMVSKYFKQKGVDLSKIKLIYTPKK